MEILYSISNRSKRDRRVRVKVAMYARFGNEPQPETDICFLHEEQSCKNVRKNIFEVAEIIARLEREWNLSHSRKKY